MDHINIQLADNVKARIIEKDFLNEYSKGENDLTTRSQIETYYYMKRQLETMK